jgi:gamma-glutamylcyclotransferase (GGCT)/AIG2-like uncharacterized protein YtfP
MADTITQFKRYVFVYGTLRRGERRDINLLLPTPFFVGYGQTPGVLYDLGAYPGVRLGGSQFVHGEVYQISPELERQLDEIEEVWPQQTGEYTRQEVRVAFTGASATSGSVPEQTCLIYEIAARRMADIRVIASGDWLKRSP